LGRDLNSIPCFKWTFLYGIGSACGVGMAYNLATSRSPKKLVIGTYTTVTFGYW